MNRTVQLVILCEDRQHETFARRFLRKAAWSTRRLRVEMAPPGKGSAEQFVRERFPIEVLAYRKNRHRVAEALIVMLDGDAKGVSARLSELEEACCSKQIEPRKPDERVAVFVPTWNIETWLEYLNGANVSETNDDYPRLARESLCKPHVDELYKMCQQGLLRSPAPASLTVAWEEYKSRLAQQ